MDSEDPLFHPKEGYFNFEDEDKTRIGFRGTFNESAGGLKFQYEKVDVFRSYEEEDKKRLDSLIRHLDEEWEGNSPNLKVFPLNENTLKEIYAKSPEQRPKFQKKKPKIIRLTKKEDLK